MSVDYRHLGIIIVSMLVLTIIPASITGQGIGPVLMTNVEIVTLSEDAAIITWVTNIPADTKVEYGTSPDLGTTNIVAEASNYHVAEITGLSGGKTYYYRVGSGNQWTDVSTFLTLRSPGGGRTLQFAIVADPHIDADGVNSASGSMNGDGPMLLESTLTEINNDTTTQFVIVTGDMTQGARDDFQLFAKNMDVLDKKFHLVLGNSDKNEANWDASFSEYFPGRSRFHSFDAGGFHFVILDSAVEGKINGAFDGAQMTWLESDLDARKDVPTLVFLHHEADSTDDIYGLEPESKDRLDGILRDRPWAFALVAGHNHQNKMTQYGKRVYVTTASTVQYPIGYGIVRVYDEGFSQHFRKTVSELQISEESRRRINTASGSTDEDQLYLGPSLEDRSFVQRLPKNQGPVLESIKVSKTTMDPGDNITVTVQASDPDGDRLFYEYTVNGGTIEGEGPRVYWNTPTEPGTYNVVATVSDGELTSQERTAEIWVNDPNEPPPDNRPPVIRSLTLAENPLQTGESTEVFIDAYDPDGDAITIEVSANHGTTTYDGSRWWYEAPGIEGTYRVTANAYDGTESSNDISADVLVFSPDINKPPVMRKVTASDSLVVSGDIVQLEAEAEDDDGDRLEYEFTVSGGTIDHSTKTSSTAQWTAPDRTGSYIIAVKAYDGEEFSNEKTVTISVKEETSGSDGSGDSGQSIPGFEAILLLAAVVLAMLLLRLKRL